MTERRYNFEKIHQDFWEINNTLIAIRTAASHLDDELKMKTEEARKILQEVQEGIKEQAGDIVDDLSEDDNPELPTARTERIGDEVHELASKNDIHLWLADLKKTMAFDSREEAEGARKLVETAGWELGTHGYQILKEELEEDDSDSQ